MRGGGLSEPLDAQAQSQSDSAAEAQNADAAGAAVSDDLQAPDATEGDQSSNNVFSSEGGEALGADESSSAEAQEEEAGSQDGTADIPALDVINQDVALETVVAQAESTRSYFLAQTLESTRTVPIVSAKLPLDTSSSSASDTSTASTGQPEGENEVDGSSEGDGSEEGGDGSDDPDLDEASQDDSVAARLVWQPAEHTGLSPDSVVIGSFTYLGMTFAMEPGGETVALVAVDYNQLPQEFIDAQVIVLPEAAMTSDGDLYSVTRIADEAFASLTAEAQSSADAMDEAEIDVAEDDSTSDGNDASSVISSEEGEALAVEKSALLTDSGEAAQALPAESSNDASSDGSLIVLYIPASVTNIEQDAFTGFQTLQYIVVSDDNPTYGSYDGCLYDADLSQLRLIPEGRVGSVRVAPSATSVNPEALSHCAKVDTLVADPDSEAAKLLEDNDFYNANEDELKKVVIDEENRDEWPEVFEGNFVSFDPTELDVGAAVSENSVRATYDTNATNCYLYYPGTLYFWSNETPTYNATTGVGFYIASGTTLYGTTLKTVTFEIATTLQNQYGKLNAAMTLGGGTNASTSYVNSANPAYTVYSAMYTYGTAVPVPKPMPANTAINIATNVRMNIWLQDYWYNQPLGAWFIADGTPYYYGYQKYQSGVTTLDTGHFADSTTEKVQTASGTAGTATSGGPNGQTFTIQYPEAPVADNKNQVFKGWCTKPHPDVTGAQWYYLAPGFRDTVADYSQVNTANRAVTLYAIYEDGYTITLNDVKSQATGGDEAFVALNEEIPVQKTVSVPRCEGYTFNGYYETMADGSKNYWYTKDGDLIEPEENKFSQAGHEYWLEANVELKADWLRDIALDTRKSDSSFEEVHVVWDGELPARAISGGVCDSEEGPAVHETKELPAPPTKTGYEFNGYWAHPYDESDQDSDLYYTVSDGKLVPVDGKVWDLDQDRLYAHWKYKVVLNPNTYDSDGNIVAKDDGQIWFDCSIADYRPVAGQSQTRIIRMETPLDNAGTTSGEMPFATFTAIEGAPIQLPLFQDRPGYHETRLWGTSQEYYGRASSIIELDESGVSGENPAVGTPTSFDEGVMLYASWTNPKTYTVSLAAAYSPYSTGAENQTITATYDAKLSGYDAAKFVGKTAKDGDDEVGFCGFYPAQYEKYSPNDESHPLNSGDAYKSLAYIDAEGNATRAFRPDDTSSSVTLYALWGYPKVQVTFDLQDATLKGAITGANPSDLAPVVNESGAEAGGKYVAEIITHDAMPTASPLVSQFASARSGFTFNGFWDTKWSEEAFDANDNPNNRASGSAPRQIYDEDGACLYGDGTWDKTSGITLYAHWRYTIVLDLNVYNTDGEIVLDDVYGSDGRLVSRGSGAYGAKAQWKAIVTEQKDAEDITSATMGDTVKVSRTGKAENGEAGDPATWQLDAPTFTAIDGAPLQLPELTGRRGYDSTWAWKKLGATTAFDLDASGKMTASTFRPELTSEGGAQVLVLAADWSGKAKSYDIILVTDYTNAAGTKFQVQPMSGLELSAQRLTVTYDQPVPSTITRYAEKDGGGATTRVNYVDALDTDGNLLTDAGFARNLVLKGFYRDEGTMAGPGEDNRAYLVVDADAFSNKNVKFREVYALDSDGNMQSSANPIKLFGYWGYNTTTIYFDLQGGTLGGNQVPVENLKIEGIDTQDALPTLEGRALLKDVPVRDGYTFAGWWTTPYNEGAAKVEDFSHGLTITPKRYYGDLNAEGLATNVAAQTAEHPTWEEYGDTTLYAHWKYDIAFAENTGTTGDIADVSLVAWASNNDETRAVATVPLARAGATTDKYGNVYTKGQRTATGSSDTVIKTLTVKAIAGAPVELPSAQNRRALTSSTYERVGYDPTWKWAHDREGTVGVMNVDDPTDALHDHFTAEAFEGDVPVKVGGDTAEVLLTLYAQWAGYEKDYAVRVMYDHALDESDAASTRYEAVGPDGVRDHAATLDLYVTYDSDEYYGSYDQATRTKSGKLSDSATPLPQSHSTGVRARATVQGDSLRHENLVFAGISTAPQDVTASPDNGAYGDSTASATRYWNADGSLTGDSANKGGEAFRFRAVKGADVDVCNTTTRPYVMYAVWAEPTSSVTFNLFDAPDADDAQEAELLRTTNTAGSEAAFTVQKGGAILRGGDAGQAHQLEELESLLVKLDHDKRYVFAGFWSAPQEGAYGPYEERAHDADATSSDASATPTCYYVRDRSGKLVAASASAATGTAIEGLLDASNTASGSKWLEDDDEVTLYAHWKYRISFVMDSDDVIPGTGESDMLLFGTDINKATKDAVVFSDSDYVDGLNYLTYGSGLVLPVDSGQSDAIERIRDFDKASDYGSGLGYTGYDFAAWTRDKLDSSELLDVPVGGDGYVEAIGKGRPALSGTADARLVPDTASKGAVTLRAQWKARNYTVTLKHYPSERWGDYITTSFVRKPASNRAVTVEIPYDGSFKAVSGFEAIAPPEIAGFTYLGYYSMLPEKAAGPDADSGVNKAGVQFYQPVGALSGGLSQATAAPFFTKLERDADPVATIYAYYERNTQKASFSLIDSEDGTMQPTDAGSAAPAVQTWRYGDALCDVPAGKVDPYRASAPGSVDWRSLAMSNDTMRFSRHGYDFDGFYILKPKPADYDSYTDAEKQAWHTDRANRVYLMRSGLNVDNTRWVESGLWTCDSGTWNEGTGTWTWNYTKLNGDGGRELVTTFRTVTDATGAVLLDAESDQTVYASWTPKTYDVTFYTNFKNGEVDERPTNHYYYEQVISPLPGVAEAGAPMEFLGWNMSATLADNSQWLFDKTTYKDNPNWLDMQYPKLTISGTFMPSGTSRTLSYEAVWANPEGRTIYLLSGANGSISGGVGLDGASQPAGSSYRAFGYNFTDPVNIDPKEGLSAHEPAITVKAAHGYAFRGWVEVHPADIAGDVNKADYVGLDQLEKTDERLSQVAQNVSSVTSGWNRSYDDAFENAVLFESGRTVIQMKDRYANPHTGEAIGFRDLYFVAVYQKIRDYGITLDVGSSADHSMSGSYSVLSSKVDGASGFTDVSSGERIRFSRTFEAGQVDGFELPDVVSAMDDFNGWLYNGRPIEEANLPWYDAATKRVDVAKYLAWAPASAHVTTLTADLSPKKYDIVFHSGTGTGVQEEDIVLEGVGIKDTFSLPTPATRSGGHYFSHWRLRNRTGESTAYSGVFNAGREVALAELVRAISANDYLADDSSQKSSLMDKVDIGQNAQGRATITFTVYWNDAISAVVPLEVRVKVDPENRTVLSAATELTANYGGDDDYDESLNKMQVVGLRYDRLTAADGVHDSEADSSEFAIGDELAGKVYLAVYADLPVTTSDESHLFAPENVDEDGTLASGVGEGQKPPLLIDLTQDELVFAESYPTNSGGSWTGLYNNAHQDGSEPDEDGTAHGLHSHGFRPFGKTNQDPLSIRYSLIFRDLDNVNLLDAIPMLRNLTRDSDDAADALPIAKVYYTIALAPKTTTAS